MHENERLEAMQWMNANGEYLTSRQMVDRIASLEAQIAELRAALEPLVAENHGGKDVNHARAVLAKYA